MPEHTLKVDEDNNQLRLDVFLTRNLPDLPSRTFIQKLIETQQVFVNQKNVKVGYKVTTGDEIMIIVPEEEATFENIAPENIPLNIFYEDDFLLIINKPVGMLVHPTHSCSSGTLVNALLYYCSSEQTSGRGKKKLSNVNTPRPSLHAPAATFRPGIVHRLDRETSGLIIVAKDNKTHVALARQFENHLVQKRYVALVKGVVEFEEGVIDAPLGRHPRYWDKKAVSYSELSREATTFYQVIKRFGQAATLVALFPQSGRTHQLRVHMAYLGHPILGDDKYGIKSDFPRMGLHAQAISFTHPATESYIEFSSIVPPEFYSPC